MKGTRIYPNADGFLDPQAISQPGAYGRCTAYDDKYRGSPVTDWECTAPNGARCSLSPKNHQIVENADGTITVSPSILIDFGPIHFHGYLKQGEWSVA
jgi:hypothetical protein